MTLPIQRAAPPWLQRLEEERPEGVPDATVWNLRGMLAWWREYPNAMDFLAEGAENRAIKALQTRLYREALGGVLSPSKPSRILDAACGIGRFAVPLAEAGHRVDGIDACLPSLEAAARHGAHTRGLSLTWGDVTTLDERFPEASYDLVLAFELLCYVPDIAEVVARLSTRLKPGGVLIASVEAWPGALLADPSGLGIGDLAEVLRTRVISEPDERWVQACEPSELAAILLDAGLKPPSIVGTHYVPDGPMAALLEHDRIGDREYDDAICDLERQLRTDPDLGRLPRAWLLVAER